MRQLRQHWLTREQGHSICGVQRRGGALCDTAAAVLRGKLINDILIETHVHLAAGRLTSSEWLIPGAMRGGLRNAAR